MTYRIDCKSGAEVFDTLVVMNEHQMKTSPFSQKITRSIKILHHDKGGLNNDAINLMCQKNYIQNYSKENDQFHAGKEDDIFLNITQYYSSCINGFEN